MPVWSWHAAWRERLAEPQDAIPKGSPAPSDPLSAVRDPGLDIWCNANLLIRRHRTRARSIRLEDLMRGRGDDDDRRASRRDRLSLGARSTGALGRARPFEDTPTLQMRRPNWPLRLLKR